MTFIYREIIGLRERGHEVLSYTVRPPAKPATDLDIGEVKVLYEGGALRQLSRAAAAGIGQAGPALALQTQMLRDTAAGLAELPGAAVKLPVQALSALKLAAFLRQDRIEHLHIHFAHTPAQIGMYAAKLAGIPFTIMGHANDLFERPLLLKEKGERSSGFAMITEYNRRLLLEKGVPEDKMPIIRCGLPGIPDEVPERRRGEGPPTIGSLGRLVEKKGMGDLIEAVKLIADEVPGVRLEIVGDGPLREALEAQLKGLGLEGRVSLLGAMSNSGVLGWLSGLDVFALACRRDRNGDMDGLPVALMEAIGAGVPVISTRLSGIPELIEHERTGLLAEPGNPQDLARQLSACLTDELQAERMRRAAFDHLKAEFSLEVNLDRLEQLFRGGRP
jgi:glycosyltransferase involved in cell wall biosynthesis